MKSVLKDVFGNRNVLVISSTNMLYQVFNSLWSLWWSLYLLEELGISITIVGILSTIQNSSNILFQLPGGIVADRIGRKRVVIFGTSLRVIGPIFLYFARTWELIVPGVVLNAMSSLYTPAFNAMIAESLPQERRGAAFGAYRTLTSLPEVFMPVVSGWYLEAMGIGKGVQTGLLMFILAAGIAAVARALFLKETLVMSQDDPLPKHDAAIASTARSSLRFLGHFRGTLLAMLIVSVISGFAMRMVWPFMAPYAYYHVGLDTGEYGLLQSIAMLISVPLYMVSGLIADRFGRIPCILLAGALGPVDSLSLLLVRDFNLLVVLYAVIGFAGGLGGGRLRGGGYTGGPAWDALLADIVPARDRGKISGLVSTITGIIALPASIIGGLLFDLNPHMLLAIGAGLEAVSFPITLFFFREPKGRAESSG